LAKFKREKAENLHLSATTCEFPSRKKPFGHFSSHHFISDVL